MQIFYFKVVDFDLWQPLHAAACWGHLEVVEMLAQNGANINAKTRNGETPFDICEDPDIKERYVNLKIYPSSSVSKCGDISLKWRYLIT